MAALVDSEMCSRVPIIVILGATGSGKSKLGIEIARRFCGEIISADSMQAYKGLDIITNKVTPEEQAEAPHHLLDVVTPPKSFSVVEFRDAAVPIVDRLREKKKLPVVVGGTNYYIEALLWKILVKHNTPFGDDASKILINTLTTTASATLSPADEPATDVRINVTTAATAATTATPVTAESAVAPSIKVSTLVDVASPALDASADEGVPASPSEGASRDGGGAGAPCDTAVGEPEPKRPRLDDVADAEALDALPSPELHRRLQKVDPEMARRLHPNNRRRILRSLQVFEQTGRQHSEILREQRQSEGGGPLGGPLRYPHSAIFWLKCDQETLDARLDARVDDMLKRGLVAELLDFHKRYNAQRLAENKEADYTQGIFQSIGFKEFHEYLLLDEEARESERGRSLFQAAVEALKTVTRRYARKQVRWVINRFLRQPQRQVPPVYAFDTSDPSKWNELVYEPAVHVVECLIKGEISSTVKPLPIEEPLINEPTSFHCEVCDRVFIGNIQWEAHLSSKKHKRVLQQKTKIKNEDNGSANNVHKQTLDLNQGEDLKDHISEHNKSSSIS